MAGLDLNALAIQPEVQQLLAKLFVDQWGEVPTKWEYEKNIANQTIIIGGQMENGDIKTLEVTYDLIVDSIGTKTGMMYAEGDNIPIYTPKKKPSLKEPKGTHPMDIFARVAFGFPSQKLFHFTLGSGGKLMTSLYTGTCSRCDLGIPKDLTIIYGSLSTDQHPAAFHPACFMLEKNGDDDPHYLAAMPRTLDEMRWRRRSKGSCHNESHGGADPTIPEAHSWRCGCVNAPWNLTKRMREAKRKQLMVGKYSAPVF